MGIGEPLDNYENLIKSISIMNDPSGMKIGARRITISTCGIIPGIERLKSFKPQVNLSISLHAANDKLRNELVPINKKYPLKEALSFALALAICWVWDFDAVSIILLSEKIEPSGMIITAAIIAGGSKGSVALFHNLLGVQSSAKKERQQLKELDKET